MILHRLNCTGITLIGLLGVSIHAAEPLAERPTVSFKQHDGSLQINLGGKPIAEYVWNDDQVRRPYFRHLRTPSGKQVTRNHPPIKGQDLDDHPMMHPGLWLSFGDLGGADFWRNKGRVRQVEFVQQPQDSPNSGSFTVRNSYESDDKPTCIEDCQIRFSTRTGGYLLTWDSTFRSEQNAFYFGDQEEMGLGVRVATPLAVVKGGEIADSENRKNGKQVWGTQADWCEYSGLIDGHRVGIVLMPHPRNFRRSWFHARDYGLLAANPFGQNSFTKGDKSKIIVPKGDDFRLRFGVSVYDATSEAPGNEARAYRDYLNLHALLEP